MTSGYDEAHREVATSPGRRWHIAVARPGGIWNFHVDADTAALALEEVMWRGSFGGAEVTEITITEDPR